MSAIDWNKLIKIEDKWIEKHLLSQTTSRDTKVVVRGYSIPFSGTKNSYKNFAVALSEIIGEFTHDKSQLSRLGILKANKNAQKIFGNIDPSKDGRYGELILFAIVESILRCPMVSHKIPSSFHDQVKGGDGIFIGDYEYKKGEYNTAILIGESKIWQNYSAALDDSLASVDRFHDSTSGPRFNSQEFLVAKRGIALSDDFDPEVLYNYLSPETTEHRSCIMVHPTFIMYETNTINTIERKALTAIEAETLIKNYISSRHSDHINLINEKLALFSNLNAVYLDFFILPVKSVDDFRKEVFYEIHGINYTK
ncbi:DUF1837 domain-containing protein [Hymenobacter sp. J193]|uniref:DUF1837 domain-containing protein n=1 Tax=Hymenobacter sp. J193 TaxID=2898429 RepID=UPI002151156E|nr:DUF1837 domain-containing protein [Hymenobacter sp. J193]MCR5889254.1 DUF1837 domain-containing protein [Hymenobacter sp. J193]